MAKIIRSANGPARSMWKAGFQVLLLGAAGMGFLVAFAWLAFHEYSHWLLTLPVVAAGMFLSMNRAVISWRIYRQGYRGEKEVLSCLRKLPGQYRIYSSLVIRGPGGTCEADQLVLGPGGIFLIEDKNLRGTVRGQGEQEPWTLLKTGSKGGRYRKELSSPVRQVQRQKAILERLLDREDLRVPVETLVVFGKDTTVEAQGGGTLLVSLALSGGCEQLNAQIMNAPKRISETRITELKELLDSLKRGS